MSDRWPDELLDAMRDVADDEIDPIMERLYAKYGPGLYARLRAFLETWTEPVTPMLPEELAEFFERPVDYPDWVDPEKIAVVETLFLRYGPVALVVLLLNGFPRAMTNPEAATAIDAAKLFNPLIVRQRMREVIQFTLNTSRRGGMSQIFWSSERIRKNLGIWSTQKLRLKHSRIRLRIAQHAKPPWDYAKLGKIINQEALADAMLQFCLGIVEGLPKAGIVQTPDQQEAMINMWSTIGFLLGLRPELHPANVAEARELRDEIFRRTAQKSQAGINVIADLIRTADDILPWWLHGSTAALMRYQLGESISAMLEVPRAPFWSFLLWLSRPFFGVGGPFAKLTVLISPHIVRWLMREEEGAGCQVQDPDALLILGVDPREV